MYARKSADRDSSNAEAGGKPTLQTSCSTGSNTSSTSGQTSPSHRTVRFSPLLPVNNAINSAGRIVRDRKESLTETYDQLRMTSVKLKEPVTKKSVKVSVWILTALVVLLLSNVLYLISFLTLNWGVVDLPLKDDQEKDWWNFGLWQTCRHSDGLCLGPRWPSYFSATRAFAVLGLFGNVLSFAWMLGYTLEKLMDYDPCTVASLSTLSFTSALFVFISVTCFGVNWPKDFEHEYKGVQASLSWSYAFAVTSALLLIAAGILGVLELKSIIMRLAAKQIKRHERHKKKNLEHISQSADEQVQLNPYECNSLSDVEEEDDDDAIP